jgi:hypothetical protein
MWVPMCRAVLVKIAGVFVVDATDVLVEVIGIFVVEDDCAVFVDDLILEFDWTFTRKRTIGQTMLTTKQYTET